MTVILSAQLVPTARKFVPPVPEPLWALSREQRLCQGVGAYNVAGATLKVRATLACPAALHTAPPAESVRQLAFERFIVRFPYGNDALLTALMGAVERVNSAACPAVASLRSHVLTGEEAAGAVAGTLDVVTGFQLIDAGSRLFVLEAVAGRGAEALHAVARRRAVNSAAFTLLASRDVRFRERLFTPFGLAPKNVRLRDALATVVVWPATYDAQAVPPALFAALNALAQLPSATTMDDARALGLFPTAEGVLQLENKFGGTVSLVDLYGDSNPAAHAVAASHDRLAAAEGATDNHLAATLDATALLAVTLTADASRAAAAAAAAEAVAAAEVAAAAAAEAARRRVQSHNPEFESTRRVAATIRDSRDWVAEHMASMADASDSNAAVKTAVRAEAEEMVRATMPPAVAEAVAAACGWTRGGGGGGGGGSTVVGYSGQRLNSVEAAKATLRAVLAADTSGSYTMAPEYGSAAVPLIDEGRMAATAAAESRAKWKTARGFVYPAPRPASEYARHPDAVSPARAAELAAPWPDPWDAAAALAASERAAAVVGGRAPFTSIPIPAPLPHGEFGYRAADGRDATLAFNKSVHLPPGGMAAELEAAAAAAAAEWQSRVVVDTPYVVPYTSKDASRADRYKPLLHGSPMKLGLKGTLARRTGSASPPPGSRTTGGGGGLEAAPVSLALTERWVDPRTTSKAFRPEDTAADRGFRVHTVLDTVKMSHVHRPLRAAGLSVTAPIGAAPVLATHVRGINTDAPSRPAAS